MLHARLPFPPATPSRQPNVSAAAAAAWPCRVYNSPKGAYTHISGWRQATSAILSQSGPPQNNIISSNPKSSIGRYALLNADFTINLPTPSGDRSSSSPSTTGHVDAAVKSVVGFCRIQTIWRKTPSTFRILRKIRFSKADRRRFVAFMEQNRTALNDPSRIISRPKSIARICTRTLA